jgi:subtilisin family serine protease
VVSVAAIDANRIVAPFSTFNSDVELSGPGVDVLSTVPIGTGVLSTLVVGSTTYFPATVYGSPFLSSSAPLADFGIGDKEDAAVSGKVCLIARSQILHSEKVLNCQKSGGVAAILYNNVPGGFSAYLQGAFTTIPSLTVSGTDGMALLQQLEQMATVTVSDGNDYDYFDGTSMATPHVSAVAALVWARNPKCTAAQLRNSLAKSALDLGAKGRDKYYGYGLVQAKAADDRIKKRGCGK